MPQVFTMTTLTKKTASSGCTVVCEYLVCIVFTFIFLVIGALFFLCKTVITRIVCVLRLGGAHDSVDYRSSLFTDDTKTPVVSVLKFNGNMTKERVRRILQENIFLGSNNAGEVEKNKLHCQQPQHYPVSVWGYWFWKFDSTFNLENHIHEKEFPIDSKAEYSKIVESIYIHLLNKGFPPNKSPWDVTVFTGKKCRKGTDYTVVAIRLHHALADAKSALKLVVQVLGNKKCTASAASMKRKDLSIAQIAIIPFYMFQHNMETLQFLKLTKGHSWIVSNARNDGSPLLVKMSQEISLNVIKSGKYSRQRACTSAYVIAAITGAVKKFAEKFQSPYLDSLPIVLSLPAPNHPDYLGNYWLVGVIKAPVAAHTEFDRLKICHKNYKSLNGSSMNPVCMSVMMNIVESFPAPLKCMLPKLEIFPAGMSNIAGENEELWIDGFQCLDYSFCSGQANTPIGVMFYIFSYRGNIRVTVVRKSSVIDEVMCEALVTMLDNELTCLTS